MGTGTDAGSTDALLAVDLEEGHFAEAPRKHRRATPRRKGPWIAAAIALLALLGVVGIVIARKPPPVAELHAAWAEAFRSGSPQARADALAALHLHHPGRRETRLAGWHEGLWKGARTIAAIQLGKRDDVEDPGRALALVEPFRPAELAALGGVVPEEDELFEPDAPETAPDAPLARQLDAATRRVFAQRLSAWRGLPAGDRKAFGAGTAADFVRTHAQLAYPAGEKTLPADAPLNASWDAAACLREAQLAVHRARKGYSGLFASSLEGHDAQISVLILQIEGGE